MAQQIGEALAWLALGLGLWIGVGRGRGLVGWQGSCLSRAVRTRAAEARRPWHPRRFRRLRSGREVAGIALRAPPRSRRTRARDPLCHRPLPLGTHASAEARATSTQHDHGSARRGRKRAWPRRRRHCHISRLGPRAVRAWEAGFEVRWPCGTKPCQERARDWKWAACRRSLTRSTLDVWSLSTHYIIREITHQLPRYTTLKQY